MWDLTPDRAIEFMGACVVWMSLSEELGDIMDDDRHASDDIEHAMADSEDMIDYSMELLVLAGKMGRCAFGWPLGVDLRPVWDATRWARVWERTRSSEAAAMFEVSRLEAETYLARIENAVFDAARDSKGGEPPAIDYEDIARKLRADGYATPAALVEYMAGRDVADADELKRHVHGDEGVSDDAVRKNADRTTSLLVEVLADTRTALIYQWRGGSISKRVI